MLIKSASKYYFYFQLTDEEKENNETQRLIDNIKKNITYKNRYWIKEKKIWAIHKDKYNIFMELIYEYYYNIINKQYELFEEIK